MSCGTYHCNRQVEGLGIKLAHQILAGCTKTKPPSRFIAFGTPFPSRAYKNALHLRHGHSTTQSTMEEAAPKSKATRTAASASASVPGVSGVGSGRDRISELPDGVLGAILSLLPLKDAGRTATLSTRWRGVFACSSIALDDERVGRRRLGRPPAEAVLHARARGRNH